MKTETNTKSKVTIIKATVSFLVFLIGWTVWITVKRKLNIGDIIPGILSIGDFIWIFSGIFLVYYNRDRLYLQPKEMLSTIPRWKTLFAMLLIVVLYYIAVMFNTYGQLHMKLEDGILHVVIMFLIVGFQEELLFRGYFFNTFASVFSTKMANLISGVMFLLIHVPGWIMRGYSGLTIASTGIGVFLLGLFFGYSFYEGKSLWGAVFLHMVWDTFSRLV